MRTVSGFGRQFVRLVSRLVPRRSTSVAGFRTSATATAGRPLLTDRLGPQRHAGAVLDQVDGTTCGSAVLVALAAWADPEELTRLEASATGQPLVGRRASGRATTPGRSRCTARRTGSGRRPWARPRGGRSRWLRDHVPAAGRAPGAAGRRHVRGGRADLIEVVGAALAAGRPVPLLVGAFVPRHYVLATRADDGGWRVYEPTSGQVRLVDLAVVRERRLGPLLGFDRLHAALLPS